VTQPNAPTRLERCRSRLCVLICLAALAAACSTTNDSDAPVGSAGGSGGAGAATDGGSDSNPLGRARCQPPPGTTGSPRTIEQAVALLNALPKPTSVACFVESLDRPLLAFATDSPNSAQPALSSESPRLFLKIDRLWLSVVIDGESSYLIEFSYMLEGEGHQSIKAELLLPLETPVEFSAPYDRVLYQNGRTVCGFCHFGERRVESIGFAEVYASEAFRPRSENYVSIQALALEAQICNWQEEPHRCEMLAAVFGGGAVVEAGFPETMATFF
jgi:hypothetical protein